jgi:hypothetical protein
LEWLAGRLDRPIYFVLGNHDYYGGSIHLVQQTVQQLESPWLHWLPAIGVVRLTRSCGLVGHGGWGDGRLGDALGTSVILGEYLMVEDFRRLSREGDPLSIFEDRSELVRKQRELGDDAARMLEQPLVQALELFEDVYVLTHVPPFAEVVRHQGQEPEPAGLPGFCCHALGELLRETALRWPHRQLQVLCGHTHEASESQILPNLHVRCQAARYGYPDFQILELAPGDRGMATDGVEPL